jgi:hypothetical protein
MVIAATSTPMRSSRILIFSFFARIATIPPRSFDFPRPDRHGALIGPRSPESWACLGNENLMRVAIAGLALLWIILLIAAAGLKKNAWILLAVGGIGIMENVFIAGWRRRPPALSVRGAEVLPPLARSCFERFEPLQSLFWVFEKLANDTPIARVLYIVCK